MSETTHVPTIEQTINDVLRNGGYGSYASQPVVGEIVRALNAREQVLVGSPTPGTVASAEAANTTEDQVPGSPLNVEERLAFMSQQIHDLTVFARQNGYSM